MLFFENQQTESLSLPNALSAIKLLGDSQEQTPAALTLLSIALYYTHKLGI